MNVLVTYSRMIRLSHTIFALPFALAAGVLAAREVPVGAWQWLLIILCMVTARSSAMGFNRIVDRDIDAKNPRTAGREIPAGEISVAAAWVFTLGSALLFVVFAGLLSRLTLYLAPVALAVIFGYSLSKRWTVLCHVILGLALALAPTAVWIALTGGWGWTPALLSLAVGTWVAGFDIIYACQDAKFDQEAGLRSIPAAMGIRTALWVSAGFHLVTIIALSALPWVISLSWVYGLGVTIIALVLVYEHAIVRPDDLSRVDRAFFDLNGYVSVLFFAAVLVG